MGYLDNFNDEWIKYFKIIEEQNAILANLGRTSNVAELAISNAGFNSLSDYERTVEIANRVSMDNTILEVLNRTEISALYSEWNDIISATSLRNGYYSIFGTDEILREYQSRADIITAKFSILLDLQQNFVKLYPEYDIDEDEMDDAQEIDEKIISALINPTTGENFKESNNKLIITALPIPDKVLRYFAENPQELYKLNPRDFEKLMADIYCKLGYDVKLTQATRDGGKDIILTEHSAIGDWVYYAECKHHKNKSKKVGVGVIRQLYGTITAEKVNGGIIATNSFFSKPARNLIINDKCSCHIKLHDGDKIIELMKQIIQK